jgi:hypothetical protein
MAFDMRGEASIEIDVSPDDAYAFVSDITRMGEWSPECVGVEWMEGHVGPAVGAQFNGHNKRGDNAWTTPNTVIAADPGREFAWVVGTPEFRVTEWRFRFEPSGSGTKVTESFELGDVDIGFASTVAAMEPEKQEPAIAARRTQLVEDMRHTLAAIKAAAEAG